MFNINRYAASLRKRYASKLVPPRRLTHSYVRENVTRLGGIKAVIWDIYGTLVRTESGDISSSIKDRAGALQVFSTIIEEFGFDCAFKNIKGPPEKWMLERYLDRIDKADRAKRRKGEKFPEVRIERIWQDIIESLARRGYKPDLARFGEIENLAQAVAYHFDLVISNTSLYRGAARVVRELNRRGFIQGIISNAQFYTPINLHLMLKDELGEKYRRLDDYFHRDLRIFSYNTGSCKPGKAIFEQAIKALDNIGLKPGECLYIGNDMYRDVWGAWRHGFKTVYAAHDQNACRSRIDKRQCHKLVPDAITKSLRNIPHVAAAPGDKLPDPPLNLGVAHYHLYPSGVKTVMMNNAVALSSRKKYENIFVSIFASIEENISSAGIFSIKDLLPHPVNNLHIHNIDVESLDYSARTYRSRKEFIKAARETKRAIVSGIDFYRATEDNPYILHVHNFSLAKNPTVPMALRLIAMWALQHKKPLLILNQIHDFVENNQSGQMQHALNCTGKYDPEFASSFLYPDLPNVFYAVLNREDMDNLISVGIAPERALLLPNSVGSVKSRGSAPESSEYLDQLKSVIARTAKDSGFYFEADRKIILQPVKPISRKNIAESVLLLSAINKLGPDHQLLVTLTPNSISDIHYCNAIKRFVKRRQLPVYIGLDHREVISGLDRRYRPQDMSMLRISDVFNIATAVISTSFIEGFGLPFIEGWLFGKYVFGRRIDAVIDDFEQNGLEYSSLYDKIAIDFDWLDISIDLLVSQYRNKINRNRQMISLPPLDKAKVKREVLLKKIFDLDGKTCIDYADLSLQSQLKLIDKLINTPSMMEKFIEDNPVVGSFAGVLRKPPTDVIDSNRRKIINRYGARAQATRLIKSFEKMRDCYNAEKNLVPDKHWINNRYLIEKYLSVENTRLLL
jgi:putative hydrolase of the HAD superfamily